MALRITLLDTRQHDRVGFVCSVELWTIIYANAPDSINETASPPFTF